MEQEELRHCRHLVNVIADVEPPVILEALRALARLQLLEVNLLLEVLTSITVPPSCHPARPGSDLERYPWDLQEGV